MFRLSRSISGSENAKPACSLPTARSVAQFCAFPPPYLAFPRSLRVPSEAGSECSPEVSEFCLEAFAFWLVASNVHTVQELSSVLQLRVSRGDSTAEFYDSVREGQTAVSTDSDESRSDSVTQQNSAISGEISSEWPTLRRRDYSVCQRSISRSTAVYDRGFRTDRSSPSGTANRSPQGEIHGFRSGRALSGRHCVCEPVSRPPTRQDGHRQRCLRLRLYLLSACVDWAAQ